MLDTPPRWLMAVWADIGGSPPPRQQWKFGSMVNSVMQGEVPLEAALEEGSGLERGLVVSRGVKMESEEKCDVVRPELGVDKATPELAVGKETIQWSQLQGTRPEVQGTKPGAKSELQRRWRELKEAIERRSCKAKVVGASEGGAQWFCRACAKSISASNWAKHMKRIHPRAFVAKRGRPKGDGRRIRRKRTRMQRDDCQGIDVS